MATSSDNFNRSSGPLGANWNEQLGSVLEIASSEVHHGTANARAQAYWVGSTFGADQYSEALVRSSGASTNFYYVCVRCSSNTPSESAYLLRVNGSGSSATITKFIDAAGTNLLSIAETFSTGDTIRLEIRGSTITAKKNGAVIGTTTDTDRSTGAPGIAIFGSGARLDNWEGGDLAAEAAGSIRLRGRFTFGVGG